jgi:methylenetetrahydrofolate reductase (NADPH)
MRYIRELLQTPRPVGRPLVSFEFFTPKTQEGDLAFFGKTLPALLKLKPDYCSVTYGAGGTSRDKTLSMVDAIQKQGGLPVMAHITCIGSTRTQILDLLENAKRLQIRNILALRGDPPAGASGFEQVPGGFRYAHELVSLTRSVGGFSVGVAGFPEGHVECREGKEVDWERLKAKIDSGADFVVTQLFFDNSLFHRFREHLSSKLGVSVPVIPGIIPILSAGQIQRFVQMSGASIPKELASRLDQLGGDDSAVTEFGIEYATRQCRDLIQAGVPGLHFYTLNKALPTTRILTQLGLASSEIK